MTKAKSYEERINNLQRIIQKQRIENARIVVKLAEVAAERDALKGLVNHDK